MTPDNEQQLRMQPPAPRRASRGNHNVLKTEDGLAASMANGMDFAGSTVLHLGGVASDMPAPASTQSARPTQFAAGPGLANYAQKRWGVNYNPALVPA